MINRCLYLLHNYSLYPGHRGRAGEVPGERGVRARHHDVCHQGNHYQQYSEPLPYLI